MPIYEYHCEACEDEFELLLRSGEQPACPACQSEKLTRKFSVVAAHSSGSSSDLPICGGPAPQDCGLPQCGGGRCAFEG
jgi:putative FmdB family regulatory protein